MHVGYGRNQETTWKNAGMTHCLESVLCVPVLKSSSFDVTNLQPLNKHLLTIGVDTYACHSRHEKRLHIKGLSLCLGPAFGLLGPSSTSVERFIPCELATLRRM